MSNKKVIRYILKLNSDFFVVINKNKQHNKTIFLLQKFVYFKDNYNFYQKII